MRIAAAVLLFVNGGISLIAGLFCAFCAVGVPIVMMAEGTRPGDPPAWFGGLFYGGIALLQLVCGGFTLLGGYNTLHRGSWSLALTGGITATLAGLSCCNGLGLIMGVIALVFVCLPDVRAEFEAEVA